MNSLLWPKQPFPLPSKIRSNCFHKCRATTQAGSLQQRILPQEAQWPLAAQRPHAAQAPELPSAEHIKARLLLRGNERDMHIFSGNASLSVAVGNLTNTCMRVDEAGAWVGGGVTVDARNDKDPQLLLRVDGETRWCRAADSTSHQSQHHTRSATVTTVFPVQAHLLERQQRSAEHC